jgi:hypothetical protein
MANNYCESSSKLYLKPEQLEQAWKIVARIESEFEDEDEPLGVEIEVEDDGVWFYHDESINPDHMAVVVQALLDELEIDEPFCFSWSYTCSKPRIDEFGGGACALKRGQPAYWVDAMSLAQNHFKDADVSP